MRPEKRLESRITHYMASLRKKGVAIVWWKNHGSAMSRAGIPDLTVVFMGIAYFVELKAEDGQASRIQEHTIEQIKNAGGRAGVVRTVEEFRAMIDGPQ